MNHYWGSLPRASRFPPPLTEGWSRNEGIQIFEERSQSCRTPNLGQRSQKFRVSTSTKDTWKICELLGSAPSWASGSLPSALKLEEGHRKPKEKLRDPYNFLWYIFGLNNSAFSNEVVLTGKFLPISIWEDITQMDMTDFGWHERIKFGLLAKFHPGR